MHRQEYPFRAQIKEKSPVGFSQAHDWIDEITTVWSRGGTHTMELARLVLTARKRLCYGEWTQLWKSGEMPFSKRKGEMLVVIGERMGRIDAETFAHLPTGWSVLYWLARLEWETLKNLVEQGIVHPKLRLQDAKRLAIKPWSHPDKRPSRRNSVKRRLHQFRDYIRRTLTNWQSEERELAKRELTRLLESIEASGSNRSEIHLGDDRTGHRPGIRIFPTHGTATIHLLQQP